MKHLLQIKLALLGIVLYSSSFMVARMFLNRQPAESKKTSSWNPSTTRVVLNAGTTAVPHSTSTPSWASQP
jgi:hypothetical protein